MLLWWRDFLFFLFPLVGKRKDNKDSERWRRKERRDLINELQHLRRGGLAAGAGGSGVCSALTDADGFFPCFTLHGVPDLQGQGRAQPFN